MSAEFNCTRTPVARREHKCDECFRVIGAGETYSRTAAVWDGDFFTNVACAHCAAAREIVANVDPDYRDYYYGGLLVTVQETWSDYDVEDGIARLAGCLEAKWRYQSGALMPIPEEPAR